MPQKLDTTDNLGHDLHQLLQSSTIKQEGMTRTINTAQFMMQISSFIVDRDARV